MALNNLVYQNNQINQRGEMLSLTDMWRAAGSDPSKRPADWARLPATNEFVAHICDVVGKSHDDIIQTLRGNEAGTWGHWQIAMAYAKYLSPEFHAWCNEVVKAHMEGRNVPVQTTGAIIAFSEDRFFDALASAMAPVTAGIVAILEKQGKTDNRVDRVEMDVCAIKHDVLALRSDVFQIANRGRKKIKDSVKSEIVSSIQMLGGSCPCCGLKKIVGDNSELLGNPEFDHFYQNSQPGIDHVWLICKSCHAELTYGKIQRGDRQDEFNAFQKKRRRLPKAQQTLLEVS